MFFDKVPCLATGTSLLSFSLFLRSVLEFHSVETSTMRNFDLYFPSDPFFSRILAWRTVDWVNRTFPIGSKTICTWLLRDSLPWETSASESCETQPNCGKKISLQPLHYCRRFLFFCGNSSLSLIFCLVVHQPDDAGTNTYPWLHTQFLFCKIDIWEDANTHKAIACKYLSNNICTVVEEWQHGYFCLG